MRTTNYLVVDERMSKDLQELPVEVQEICDLANVVILFKETENTAVIYKHDFAKEDLSDFDTELALVYIKSLPFEEQPDYEFLVKFEQLHRSAKRIGHVSALHIYENQQEFDYDNSTTKEEE